MLSGKVEEGRPVAEWHLLEGQSSNRVIRNIIHAHLGFSPLPMMHISFPPLCLYYAVLIAQNLLLPTISLCKSSLTFKACALGPPLILL